MMGMYKKNNWQDEAGRVYVVYPEKEIMDDMNRSENSVTKYLNELEDADLIETVQRGQGRTNIIYVKNFELVEEEAAEVRSSNIESLEVQKSDFKKCEKQTSRSSKNEPLEVQKTDTNNTKENYININNTDPILSITEEKDDAIDGMEEYQAYSEIIKENIEYDALLQRNPYEKDAIQGIFDLILETVISNKASMTISGQEYPMNLVKSKFLKLNSSHIEYVLGCLGKNTTKVYNIKSYLLASLFNAVSTMNSYYKAEVNHDMPQFASRVLFSRSAVFIFLITDFVPIAALIGRRTATLVPSQSSSFAISERYFTNTKPFVGSSFPSFAFPQSFLYLSGMVLGFALYGGFMSITCGFAFTIKSLLSKQEPNSIFEFPSE